MAAPPWGHIFAAFQAQLLEIGQAFRRLLCMPRVSITSLTGVLEQRFRAR